MHGDGVGMLVFDFVKECRPAPLGRPIALTLALSRRAGEGTVVVFGSVAATGFGHPLRASHASPSLCEGEV